MTIDLSDAPEVAGPSVATPARRPGSVRRTSTIDMSWPGGWGTQMTLLGRARDLFTPADGSDPVVLGEDILHVGVAPDRTLERITAEPARPQLQHLLGARGGGKLRGLLAQVVPEELHTGTPLYLLLDDLSGATLVSGFAFSQWPDAWPTAWGDGEGSRMTQRRMEGICTGFSPGASSLNPDGTSRFNHDIRTVATIRNEDDPLGWHHMTDTTAVSMRRSRRIDVHLGDVIEIDSFFQDSATTANGDASPSTNTT